MSKARISAPPTSGFRGGTCDRCGEPFVDRSPAQRKRWCSDKCRRRNEAHKVGDPCPGCGAPRTREQVRQGAQCLSCERARRREEVAARGHRIEAWWAEGLSLLAIAAKLGWSVGHLGKEMDRLRARGFDLPYRRQPRQGRYPELRRAA